MEFRANRKKLRRPYYLTEYNTSVELRYVYDYNNEITFLDMFVDSVRNHAQKNLIFRESWLF